MKDMNILIVGVGGQGTLLASRILGTLAQNLGLDVKVSEVHGMSQRGGSVVTYVRMGETVHSPLIENVEADAMLAFEELEALRYAHLVRPGGSIIVNTQRMAPISVAAGKAAYPADVLERLEQYDCHLEPVDALSLAEQAGSVRAVNTVILGALARRMGLEEAECLEALDACVPPKTVETNRKAFRLGYGA